MAVFNGYQQATFTCEWLAPKRVRSNYKIAMVLAYLSRQLSKQNQRYILTRTINFSSQATSYHNLATSIIIFTLTEKITSNIFITKIKYSYHYINKWASQEKEWKLTQPAPATKTNLYFFRKGGTEQHCLSPATWGHVHLFHYLSNLRFKSHIQHPVCLIKC
jgi:hypothetical protein